MDGYWPSATYSTLPLQTPSPEVPHVAWHALHFTVIGAAAEHEVFPTSPPTEHAMVGYEPIATISEAVLQAPKPTVVQLTEHALQVTLMVSPAVQGSSPLARVPFAQVIVEYEPAPMICEL